MLDSFPTGYGVLFPHFVYTASFCAIRLAAANESDTCVLAARSHSHHSVLANGMRKRERVRGYIEPGNRIVDKRYSKA